MRGGKRAAVDKLKRMWAWLRKNVFNAEMFVFVLIAELIFWSPCIVTAILAWLINPWYWTAFSAICLFWTGPFTPAMPLQLGLAVLLKKLWQKIKRAKSKKDVYNKTDGGDNGQN